MKDIIKAILALIIVVLLAIFVFYASPEKEKVVNSVQPTPTKTFTPQGRVDVFVPLDDEKILEVKFDENNKEKENWSKDKEWYTIQSNDKNFKFTLTALKGSQITIYLRGPWEKNNEGKLIEHWVKFTSLKIDGKEFLNLPQEVWHDKPYDYTFLSKKDKTYTIEVVWEPK